MNWFGQIWEAFRDLRGSVKSTEDVLEKQYPQIRELPVNGYYSEPEYLWVIEKQENWNLDKENGFLHVGNAGCDGIELGLREGMQGIWAFYPIDNEYIKKAETVVAFIQMWRSGKINV